MNQEAYNNTAKRVDDLITALKTQNRNFNPVNLEQQQSPQYRPIDLSIDTNPTQFEPQQFGSNLSRLDQKKQKLFGDNLPDNFQIDKSLSTQQNIENYLNRNETSSLDKALNYGKIIGSGAVNLAGGFVGLLESGLAKGLSGYAQTYDALTGNESIYTKLGALKEQFNRGNIKQDDYVKQRDLLLGDYYLKHENDNPALKALNEWMLFNVGSGKSLIGEGANEIQKALSPEYSDKNIKAMSKIGEYFGSAIFNDTKDVSTSEMLSAIKDSVTDPNSLAEMTSTLIPVMVAIAKAPVKTLLADANSNYYQTVQELEDSGITLTEGQKQKMLAANALIAALPLGAQKSAYMAYKRGINKVINKTLNTGVASKIGANLINSNNKQVSKIGEKILERQIKQTPTILKKEAAKLSENAFDKAIKLNKFDKKEIYGTGAKAIFKQIGEKLYDATAYGYGKSKLALKATGLHILDSFGEGIQESAPTFVKEWNEQISARKEAGIKEPLQFDEFIKNMSLEAREDIKINFGAGALFNLGGVHLSRGTLKAISGSVNTIKNIKQGLKNIKDKKSEILSRQIQKPNQIQEKEPPVPVEQTDITPEEEQKTKEHIEFFDNNINSGNSQKTAQAIGSIIWIANNSNDPIKKEEATNILSKALPQVIKSLKEQNSATKEEVVTYLKNELPKRLENDSDIAQANKMIDMVADMVYKTKEPKSDENIYQSELKAENEIISQYSSENDLSSIDGIDNENSTTEDGFIIDISYNDDKSNKETVTKDIDNKIKKIEKNIDFINQNNQENLAPKKVVIKDQLKILKTLIVNREQDIKEIEKQLKDSQQAYFVKEDTKQGRKFTRAVSKELFKTLQDELRKLKTTYNSYLNSAIKIDNFANNADGSNFIETLNNIKPTFTINAISKSDYFANINKKKEETDKKLETDVKTSLTSFISDQSQKKNYISSSFIYNLKKELGEAYIKKDKNENKKTKTQKLINKIKKSRKNKNWKDPITMDDIAFFYINYNTKDDQEKIDNKNAISNAMSNIKGWDIAVNRAKQIDYATNVKNGYYINTDSVGLTLEQFFENYPEMKDVNEIKDEFENQFEDDPISVIKEIISLGKQSDSIKEKSKYLFTANYFQKKYNKDLKIKEKYNYKDIFEPMFEDFDFVYHNSNYIPENAIKLEFVKINNEEKVFDTREQKLEYLIEELEQIRDKSSKLSSKDELRAIALSKRISFLNDPTNGYFKPIKTDLNLKKIDKKILKSKFGKNQLKSININFQTGYKPKQFQNSFSNEQKINFLSNLEKQLSILMNTESEPTTNELETLMKDINYVRKNFELNNIKNADDNLNLDKDADKLLSKQPKNITLKDIYNSLKYKTVPFVNLEAATSFDPQDLSINDLYDVINKSRKKIYKIVGDFERSLRNRVSDKNKYSAIYNELSKNIDLKKAFIDMKKANDQINIIKDENVVKADIDPKEALAKTLKYFNSNIDIKIDC